MTVHLLTTVVPSQQQVVVAEVGDAFHLDVEIGDAVAVGVAGEHLVGEAQLPGGAGLRLVPGMPVEVFIPTGSRSALAYPFNPIEDALMRAFRE